jgi:hypothetical protein
LTAAVSELLAWVTEGSALATLGKVLLLAVCAPILGLIYRRYIGILGADRRKQAERQAYDALRASLAEGNMAARLYAERLTRFLNWIDRFFGDAGMAERTLFPHAFRLRTPAPLWTAPALDCCLFLALLYPIATISVIWAISGQVGLAERAFGLQADLVVWQRLKVPAAIGLVTYGYWAALTGEHIWKAAWLVVGVAGSAILLTSGAISLSTYGFALALCFTYTRQTTSARKGVLGIIAVFAAIAQSGGGAGDWYLIVAMMAGCGVLFFTSKAAVKFGLEGIFYVIFFPVTMSALLLAARLMSPLDTWEYAGPVLMFLGLLTLLSAPFDWASLGLTRALLRRGLELGGWWPYALALVDAGLAAMIIVVLAFTMVIGVQAFNTLAADGGGNPVLRLNALFDGLAANPTAPEYWWLYALLLSAMVPSLVNLVIGGTSLVRGLPGVPALLLRYIPERGGVLKWDRHWIATILTAQVAAGAALGIAAQAFLVVVIIGYVMPLFGPELLGMAHEVAAFNLPARVGHLFGISL